MIDLVSAYTNPITNQTFIFSKFTISRPSLQDSNLTEEALHHIAETLYNLEIQYYYDFQKDLYYFLASGSAISIMQFKMLLRKFYLIDISEKA